MDLVSTPPKRMRIRMEHFSERPWADFVRGISGPQISMDIRTHLAADCSTCKTALDAWSRVRRLASEESAYAPPEDLVRLAKLGFDSKLGHQSRACTPANWTLANLVFDSFAKPLPVGVRS